MLAQLWHLPCHPPAASAVSNTIRPLLEAAVPSLLAALSGPAGEQEQRPYSTSTGPRQQHGERDGAAQLQHGTVAAPRGAAAPQHLLRLLKSPSHPPGHRQLWTSLLPEPASKKLRRLLRLK